MQREPLAEGLPSLKTLTVDPTHAARQALSRPWDADPFLKNLLQAFAFHITRLCLMAEECLVFRNLFREELARCTGHPAMASALRLVRLAAKKRRPEKCNAPLGRCCLGS